MSDVIPLRAGAAAPLPNGAEPDVIALLEDALAQAQRGEVAALALVLVNPHGAIRTRVRNPSIHRNNLTAGAAYLLADMTAESRTE